MVFLVVVFFSVHMNVYIFSSAPLYLSWSVFPVLFVHFQLFFFWVLHQRINPFTSTSLLTFENLSMRYEKSQWMCSKLLFIHFRYERDSFIVQRIHYTCLFFNRHNFPCILYSTQKRFCLYDMTLLALSIFLTLSCILSCSAYIV